MADSRLYYYYFKDVEKPIVIHAKAKILARAELDDIIDKQRKDCLGKDVIDEKIVSLVSGISKISVDGKDYTWQRDQWKPDN